MGLCRPLQVPVGGLLMGGGSLFLEHWWHLVLRPRLLELELVLQRLLLVQELLVLHLLLLLLLVTREIRSRHWLLVGWPKRLIACSVGHGLFHGRLGDTRVPAGLAVWLSTATAAAVHSWSFGCHGGSRRW